MHGKGGRAGKQAGGEEISRPGARHAAPRLFGWLGPRALSAGAPCGCAAALLTSLLPQRAACEQEHHATLSTASKGAVACCTSRQRQRPTFPSAATRRDAANRAASLRPAARQATGGAGGAASAGAPSKQAPLRGFLPPRAQRLAAGAAGGVQGSRSPWLCKAQTGSCRRWCGTVAQVSASTAPPKRCV